MFQSVCIKRIFLLSGLCLLLLGVTEGTEPPKRSIIQGIVVKVFPSPKVWTGTIESVQSIDLKVTKSYVPSIKPSAVLHISVPLVIGNRLFDQQTPQFSKDKVASGKLLEVKISMKCSKSQDANSYVVEPACLKVLK